MKNPFKGARIVWDMFRHIRSVHSENTISTEMFLRVFDKI